MEYYYTKKSNVDLKKSELTVDDFEYKHLTKVLRKRAGDKITITDGERNIYHCEIKRLEKDRLICNITGSDFNLHEPKKNISLYISLLRNFSRFEFAIEKAVELGAASIYPVITEHTIIKNKLSKSKIDRLNKIIIGAMGQSQRCLLPNLNYTLTFDEMIKSLSHKTNKIVMYELSEEDSEIKFDNSKEEISLLIGPEGGFTDKEISILKEDNWLVRSLGKRKLRAETAAIVSLFEIIKN